MSPEDNGSAEMRSAFGRLEALLAREAALEVPRGVDRASVRTRCWRKCWRMAASDLQPNPQNNQSPAFAGSCESRRADSNR